MSRQEIVNVKSQLILIIDKLETKEIKAPRENKPKLVIIGSKEWLHTESKRIYDKLPKNIKGKIDNTSIIKKVGSNLLKDVRPDLYMILRREDNPGVDLNKVKCGSHKKLIWRCINPDVKCDHHIWECAINGRSTMDSGCPFCFTNSWYGKVCPCDSIASNKNLMEEWDYEKNGESELDPSKISRRSEKGVWWKCKYAKCDHHKWFARVASRNNPKGGTGCPFCVSYGSSSKVCPCDSIASIKSIMEEWDYVKNKDLNPIEISTGSGVKAAWICKREKHSWVAIIKDRISQQRGCPRCLYKSEQTVRQIFETELKYEFPKKRPLFLEGLELDGYNEEHKIAFEYNGIQHYEYTPTFHRHGIADFLAQEERDKRKVQLCKDNSILLIVVPCAYDYHDEITLKEFIVQELKKNDKL